MTVHLRLSGARILHILGWGQVPKPSAKFRLELRDPGELIVFHDDGLLRVRAFTIPIDRAKLTISTTQTVTRGGYSADSGLWGLFDNSPPTRLRALPDRTTEFATLTATPRFPGPGIRDLVLGFRSLDEARLTARLRAAVPAWTAAYVAATAAQDDPDQPDQDRLLRAHSAIDAMQTSGLLTDDQTIALRHDASQPYTDALTNRLKHQPPTRSDAAKIKADTDQLLAQHRLTNAQARQIHQQLAATTTTPLAAAPIASAPPAKLSDRRRRQLAALAALHDLGALSDTRHALEHNVRVQGGWAGIVGGRA